MERKLVWMSLPGTTRNNSPFSLPLWSNWWLTIQCEKTVLTKCLIFKLKKINGLKKKYEIGQWLPVLGTPRNNSPLSQPLWSNWWLTWKCERLCSTANWVEVSVNTSIYKSTKLDNDMFPYRYQRTFVMCRQGQRPLSLPHWNNRWLSCKCERILLTAKCLMCKCQHIILQKYRIGWFASKKFGDDLKILLPSKGKYIWVLTYRSSDVTIMEEN